MSAVNFKKDWDIDSLVSYISEIIAKESGNVLGDNQKSMVLNRLKKRLIDLGGITPSEYYLYLKNNYQNESSYLVSLLTTHHTFFFREFNHFEFLLKDLGNIVEKVKKRGDRKIRILSAACSRGQEVYSLAMFFNEHLKAYSGIDFEVMGTDIDPQSVKHAINGVYAYNEVKSIPNLYLNGNWQRGTGDISNFAKVKEHIKKKCSFSVMNLLKPEPVLRNNQFDIIMCRNVFIYFEIKDVQNIVTSFKKYLYPNGIFITGLSESLKSIDIYKQTFAPSVYCFDKSEVVSVDKEITKESSIKKDIKPVSLIPTPIKMLVVDDSNSIVKLLSKVFKSDPEFELVGTATNGLEAIEFLKNNEVDAMTLDIHMPEMDGVEYLKSNFNSKHPKVVVVSSASREDKRYAQETLKYGASDFVEKPALNNISERADEIKNKIKMSFLNSLVSSEKIDNSFQKDFSIKNVESKARVMVANFSDLKKVKKVVSELKGDQPPIMLFFEGNKNFLEVIKDEFNDTQKVEILNNDLKVVHNKIYLCDFKTDFQEIGHKIQWEKMSLSIFGIASNAVQKVIIEHNIGQVLLEDNEYINKDLREIVSDVFPWTSFSHIATEFLSKID